MTESDPPRASSELRDVHDFLAEVRKRPGMWLPGGSLQHLDSMIIGYQIALQAHGLQEKDGGAFDFVHFGPFPEWLWPRLGLGYPSALRWAVEIERAAEKQGVPAVTLFFDLLDEYAAERGEG